MAHPADRSWVMTEHRNPRSMALHTSSVEECVALIQAEDRTIPEAMERARPALVAFIRAAERGFCAGGRLVYVGAGTSGRLGVLDASEAPPTFCVEQGKVVGVIAGGDAALRRSSEGKEDDPRGAEAELRALALGANDAVIAVAAGGTTPYALGSLAIAKSLAAPPLTAFLTCTPVEKPPAADHLIEILTGPEVLTGSTRMKAGTATKLALNTISTTLMVRSGRVHENLMVDVRATNDKLRDRAARIIRELTGLTRDQAFWLLQRAGDSVKTALVMHARRVSVAEAEQELARAGGRLEAALGGAPLRHDGP